VRYNCTPIVLSLDYCTAIGMGEMGGLPRSTCPPRPDGHPERQACERDGLGGGTVVESFGGAECRHWRGHYDDEPANPFMVQCGKPGRFRMCGFNGVCSDWVEVVQ
jgi:hypothetical protein